MWNNALKYGYHYWNSVNRYLGGQVTAGVFIVLQWDGFEFFKLADLEIAIEFIQDMKQTIINTKQA